MPAVALPRSSPAVAAALLLASSFVSASAIVVPQDPVQFERVSLRQTVDSCSFAPERVQVSFADSVIKVVQPPIQCLIPGPPVQVDIQLGAFPPGDYQVELHAAADQPADQRIAFSVSGLVQPAVFPAPPFPLANYSGVWWNEAESGWGLSLHQGGYNVLFGAMYLFGEAGAPAWYTLQDGQWTSSTRWEGSLLRSSGPQFWVSPFDAREVEHSVVGSVTLEFAMLPGSIGEAALDYSIDGVGVSKRIVRARF